MKVICNKCNREFKHYNNVYGTRCPVCGALIKPDDKPNFIKEREQKIDKLKGKMKDRLRNEEMKKDFKGGF